MEENELKSIMETVFKEAYQLGKQNMLEGVHISPDVLFKQFIENNCFEFESQLPLNISQSDFLKSNRNLDTENYNSVIL